MPTMHKYIAFITQQAKHVLADKLYSNQNLDQLFCNMQQQQHDFFFCHCIFANTKEGLGSSKSIIFFLKLMFLLQLMHFQQRRLTAFYTCVYLVYQSCTAQFARFFALDGDAFYEVIIMQMFSAWRAVRHPQASKIGTTFSDEGQERDDHAYFYYFNRSGNFANMSTNLMGLIFQVSIS